MDEDTGPSGFGLAVARVDLSTAGLVDALAGLTDADVRAPSLLPGWSRGHVLTHLARNADGMTRLTGWAVTGEQQPMYESAQRREADIDAGAARGADEIVADVVASATGFRDGLARLGRLRPGALEQLVLVGPPRPTWVPVPSGRLPRLRQTEVEVHRSDLGLGYTPGDWPVDFATWLLASWTARRSAPDGLSGVTSLWDGHRAWSLRDDPGEDGTRLAGPTRWLAAWVMGRPVAEGLLRTSDGSPVPPAPPL